MSKIVILILLYVRFDYLLIRIRVWDLCFARWRSLTNIRLSLDLSSAILLAVLLASHTKLDLLYLLQTLLSDLVLCFTIYTRMLSTSVSWDNDSFRFDWVRILSCLESRARNNNIKPIILAILICRFYLWRRLSFIGRLPRRAVYLLELGYFFLLLVGPKHLANVFVENSLLLGGLLLLESDLFFLDMRDCRDYFWAVFLS